MSRQMHLDKGPVGMASRTACGRNILRTPMSTNWAEFQTEPVQFRCIRCNTSAQAEFLRRRSPVVSGGAQ